MLQLLSHFWPRELYKSLNVVRIERYSILGYLPPTPDDVQCKQLALLGIQLDVATTQSLRNLLQVLKMLLKRF
jgi:hypothetical protein